MDNKTKETDKEKAKQKDVQKAQAPQQQAQNMDMDSLDGLDMDRHKRTVDDIRFDIMCGVNVPEYEREMEVQDLYEKMQDDEYRGIFGNTVEEHEFFNEDMNDKNSDYNWRAFRERLNKQFIGKTMTPEQLEKKKIAALQNRVAGDAYLAGKIDKNGNGIIEQTEVTDQLDRIKQFYKMTDYRADMLAFRKVKQNDIKTRDYLVRKYITEKSMTDPRLRGATIETVQEERDEICFHIRFADGVVREFIPRFEKGEDRKLDMGDRVSGMNFAREFEKMLDKHEKGI